MIINVIIPIYETMDINILWEFQSKGIHFSFDQLINILMQINWLADDTPLNFAPLYFSALLKCFLKNFPLLWNSENSLPPFFYLRLPFSFVLLDSKCWFRRCVRGKFSMRSIRKLLILLCHKTTISPFSENTRKTSTF